MAYAQRESWGLEYIDLYLIHFPIALKYIEPEKLRYPVWGIPLLQSSEILIEHRDGGWTRLIKS